MAMNIKNDFHKRVSQIIRTAGTLNPFQVRGSVQPVLSYDKAMEKPEEISVPATAGNVAWSLSPGVGKKHTWLYGRIDMTADATVANRYLMQSIRNSANATLVRGMAAANIAASENKQISYHRAAHGGILTDQNGEQAADLSNMYFAGDVIYETDMVYFIFGSGQAGDSWTALFKIIEEDIPKEA